MDQATVGRAQGRQTGRSRNVMVRLAIAKFPVGSQSIAFGVA
jgi:hypothetical protein